MTNKENNHMNSTEIELKAIAKAIGGSLKRAGHTVPHSTVLHAVSAALDKRDWHKVKAALTVPAGGGQAQTSNVLASLSTSYSERTLFALRLALACGSPVQPVPSDDAEALAAARQAFPAELSGVLSWQGWNVPAALNPLTSSIDAGDFKPENADRVGRLTLHLDGIEAPLVLEVAYSATEGAWYLTKAGAAQAYSHLEDAIPGSELFLPTLTGEPILAEFWTDDRVVEASFDARPFFMQASSHDVSGIIACGYRGDYPTDAVAQYIADKRLNATVEQGFAYIGTMQATGRKNAPGFECSVNQEQMLTWLDLNRQEVLAMALCEIMGSIHEEEEEFMGGIEGYAFVPAGQDYQNGAKLFSTAEAAALAAYLDRGMLQKVRDNDM
jgi:hypothetical protein